MLLCVIITFITHVMLCDKRLCCVTTASTNNFFVQDALVAARGLIEEVGEDAESALKVRFLPRLLHHHTNSTCPQHYAGAKFI